MKKEFSQTIEVPEGVEVQIEGSLFTIKGAEGENKRKFDLRGLKMEKKGKEIIIGHEKATKREKKRINTIKARIENMIKGVQNKFEYQLKICFNHFPITVDIQGQEATIKNFLGEKVPRKTKIPEGVEVKISGQVISILCTDKELAGQAAANFEMATRIRNKDRRVFQDGIFMINKAGKGI